MSDKALPLLELELATVDEPLRFTVHFRNGTDEQVDLCLLSAVVLEPLLSRTTVLF